jgi:hypothetical protein
LQSGDFDDFLIDLAQGLSFSLFPKPFFVEDDIKVVKRRVIDDVFQEFAHKIVEEIDLELTIKFSQLPQLFEHLASLWFMAFLTLHQMGDFSDVCLFHRFKICNVVAA